MIIVTTINIVLCVVASLYPQLKRYRGSVQELLYVEYL